MKLKIKNLLFYLRYIPSLLLLIIRINKQLNKLITDPRLPTVAREKLQHPKVKHRVVQYALIHVILNSSIAKYHGRKLN